MLKRRLKEPFGKAGLTVAILALVLAMVGGAYAAGALSGKQKKEVEKIAQKVAGKPGATGPAGTPGTNGTNGAAGKDGAPGTPGASVTSTPLASGNANCAQGGAEFKAGSSGPTFACNGSPAQYPKVLPPGRTESGSWALSVKQAGVFENTALAMISFPISLAEPLPGTKVHYVLPAEWNGGTPPAECPGNPEEPQAEPGSLCLYAHVSFGFTQFGGHLEIFIPDKGPPGQGGESGAATYGAGLAGNVGPEGGFAYGSWAVTAE
jgi:hypothetical protein